MPVQYADYTLWQQEVLGRESDGASAITRQLGFWRDYLAGLPDAIELPSDRPRPPVASHGGETVALSLSRDLHAGLVGLARARGASLFMVVQACLAGLLCRLGAGDDIAIGSPIAGRTDAALDDLVGFFVNTLVLRTDTSGNPSLGELIGRVRAGNLLAYSHADVPFERLVEELNPARSLSHHPLFQVMLAFQNQEPARFEVAGLASRFEAVATATAKFDLSVSLSEERGAHGEPLGISGGIEYASDLFERASVEALAGRFIRVLEGAVAAPDRALGGVDLLSQEERATILRGWNTTAHALLPATLPALFAAQAARCPDAVAVVFEEERLCYGELDRRANQLAHHLRGLGVGPETVVGLCLARSLDLLVGLLGILKAGGAYLPLDPDYPRERLAFMLADAGARVLITHGATQAAIEEALDGALHGALLERQSIVPRMVRLDVDAAAIAEHPTSAPAVALDPHNAAYVIYTSGSTGTPKGVVVAHASLANKLLSLGRDFEVGTGFRSALVISCGFDAAIEQALLPLIGGGAAVVISDAARESPALFWHRVMRDGVSFISCVPSYLRSVIGAAPKDALLDHLALGGEEFTAEFQREITRRLEVRRITHLYGPTEATIDAVGFAVEGDQAGLRVPIGRPLSELPGLCSGRWFAGCACGGSGGAVHIGSGACAGLCGARGAHGGAVCGGPLWCGGEPDVPQRGCGALARGRGFGVSGAIGCAGEAARLSH